MDLQSVLKKTWSPYIYGEYEFSNASQTLDLYVQSVKS